MSGAGESPGRSIRLSFWPQYSNPYQALFYGEGSDALPAEPRTIEAAEAALASAAPDEIVCFHLHWLNSVVRVDSSRQEAEASARAFAERIQAFKRAGGCLIWTIHNLRSHDTPHPDVDQALGDVVGNAADIVLLHGERAVPAARALFPGIAGKELIVPHGHYRDAYASAMTRDAARLALGIAGEEMVFLGLGAIRPYKGMVEFVRDAACLNGGATPFRLVIAGRPSGVSPQELERAAAEAGVPLNLHPEEVPADEMQVFLRAAEWMVLPYRAVLTSGSAILALGFGVPVIAPRLGLLPELVEDGREGLLYDPGNARGLADALRRAAAIPGEVRRAMGDAAVRRASALRWGDARAMLRDRIHAIDVATAARRAARA